MTHTKDGVHTTPTPKQRMHEACNTVIFNCELFKEFIAQYKMLRMPPRNKQNQDDLLRELKKMKLMFENFHYEFDVHYEKFKEEIEGLRK